MRWFLWAAAFVAVGLAAGTALLAGGAWWTAGASAVVAGLAIYLASRARTTEDKLADIGRGAVVGIIVGFVAAWVDHEAAARGEREARLAAERSERESLALTLSGGERFVGIDLHDKDLSGFYVGGKDFSNADLHGVDLDGAVLRGTDFSGADLRGARLVRADLRDADLGGSDTDLSGAVLVGATMIGTNLGGARLVGADLRGANLEGASLVGADLRAATLQGAILVGTDLRLALLVGADLRGSVLSADLRDARLDGTALTGVREGRTRWPERFDLEAHIAKTLRRSATAIPEPAQPDRLDRVVDGDTIVLERLGGVRLLGANAPTSDYRPRDCYGRRARSELARFLPEGSAVRYVPGSPKRDKFGRALVYLWLEDGGFVNEVILERGVARFLLERREGQYQPSSEPYVPLHKRYAPLLRRAEVRAASRTRGLWRFCLRPP